MSQEQSFPRYIRTGLQVWEFLKLMCFPGADAKTDKGAVSSGLNLRKCFPVFWGDRPPGTGHQRPLRFPQIPQMTHNGNERALEGPGGAFLFWTERHKVLLPFFQSLCEAMLTVSWLRLHVNSANLLASLSRSLTAANIQERRVG